MRDDYEGTREFIIDGNNSNEVVRRGHSKLPDGFVETDEFRNIFQIIEEAKFPVFITGFAGTGKSTFLQYYLENTSDRPIILAPTGVAAVNVGGATIHSFFRFPPRYIPINRIERLRGWNLHNSLKVIVIDEISMVRADMMDNIDRFLRLNMYNEDEPFGGVRIIMIGDVNQLSPVVENELSEIFTKAYKSPYFFDAKVFTQTPLTSCNLTQIFRQKDPKFVSILNNIRRGVLTSIDHRMLLDRVRRHITGDVITLTTTNKAADIINYTELKKLDEEEMTYEAEIKGLFDEKYYPTARSLTLKIEAQVMILRNGPGYVNGTIGKVAELNEESVVVDIETRDGHEMSVTLTRASWERIEYDTEEDEVNAKQVGTFSQIPLKLAWAITIHKSQGLTFDKVNIDLGRGSFAHGQTYVALSRCRSLEGITLSRPLMNRDIIFDKKSIMGGKLCN